MSYPNALNKKVRHPFISLSTASAKKKHPNASIENFINGKAKAKKNGKYGYIDEQAMTLIPFEYESLGDFIEGRAKAEKKSNNYNNNTGYRIKYP